MIAVIQLKKHIAGAYIFGVVISNFNYYWELGPIVLLEVDKDLEVSFYDTILLFGLAVNLQIKSDKKSTFYGKKVAKR